MKPRIAIALFIAMFATAVWLNPGEVLPYTAAIVLWWFAAFASVILLVSISGPVAALPETMARIWSRWRFRRDIRRARAIAGTHAKLWAAHPASEEIGEIHINSWTRVRADFIEAAVVPHLGATARMELANRNSPLARIVNDIVDDAVSRTASAAGTPR